MTGDSQSSQHQGVERRILTLYVDDQHYAMPVSRIKDIFQSHKVTRVPLTHTEVGGVVNLRGRIVTALDLRYILSGKKTDLGAGTMNIAVEWKNEIYSFIVDSVSEVMTFEKKSFESNPSTLSERIRNLSDGIVKLNGHLLIVLNIERLFAECDRSREDVLK